MQLAIAVAVLQPEPHQVQDWHRLSCLHLRIRIRNSKRTRKVLLLQAWHQLELELRRQEQPGRGVLNLLAPVFVGLVQSWLECWRGKVSVWAGTLQT